MRNNPEAQAQIAFFQLLALNETKYPETRWIHASMNGVAATSKAAAGQRRAQGQKSGVADVFIPVPRGEYHGAWIELKIKPNKITPAQKEFLHTMLDAGYYVAVAWSFDDLVAQTEHYLGITLRAVR